VFGVFGGSGGLVEALSRQAFTTLLYFLHRAIAAITCAFLLGWLTPRGAAIVYILWCLFAVAALTMILNRNLKEKRAIEVLSDNRIDAPARQEIKRRIRHYTIIIIVLPFILLYGLYETRGGPLLPRVTGAVVNLLFTFAFVLALRAERRKLKN
jgi:hypothetical protein